MFSIFSSYMYLDNRPSNGAADKLRAEASVSFIRWMGGRERSEW